MQLLNTEVNCGYKCQSVVNIQWKNKVKVIIFSEFPGAESGNTNCWYFLFGEVNPSGHLPLWWLSN